MSLLSGTGTALHSFRVDCGPAGIASVAASLARILRIHAFQPINRAEPEEWAKRGFVEIGSRDAVDFSLLSLSIGDEHAAFSVRIDEIKIPGPVVRRELAAWEQAFRAEHGRPPGRKEKADAKMQIRHTLRASVPITSRTVDVTWQLAGGHLLVWTGTASEVLLAQDLIENALKVRLVPLTPITTAAALGLPEKSLLPDARLSMPQDGDAPLTDRVCGLPGAGQAVAAEVERDRARDGFLRGKAWLGREFLTWLLWRSESGDVIIKSPAGGIRALLAERVVLRGIAGDVVESVHRGTMAPYSQVARGQIGRGMLVHEARLRLQDGPELVWAATVDAESFALRGARLPPLLAEDPADQVAERIAHADRLAAIVSDLLAGFLALRAGPDWDEEVEQIREWVSP